MFAALQPCTLLAGSAAGAPAPGKGKAQQVPLHDGPKTALQVQLPAIVAPARQAEQGHDMLVAGTALGVAEQPLQQPTLQDRMQRQESLSLQPPDREGRSRREEA